MFTTTNFFAANPLSRPDVYHPSHFSPTIQELSRHSHRPSSPSWESTKIFNIAACEIDNKLISSPTQNMIDVSYQFNQSWEQFTNTPKMSDLRDQDMKTYDALMNYQFLFKTLAFDSFFTYFLSNPAKFKGNASNIIEQQIGVYNQLKSRKIPPNSCMQIDVRVPLEPNKPTYPIEGLQDNNDEAEEEEDDNDDDGAKLYNEMLQESNRNILNNEQSKPSLYGNNNENMKTFDLSQDTIDSVMRQEIAPLDIKPFSYKHYEMFLNGSQVGMYQTNNTVPGCGIEIGQSLNMILNSVNSAFINSLTFLYIVYHHTIMVYAYITDLNGKSFGSRIFEKDLLTTIPALFEDGTIDDDVRTEMNNYLDFKQDDIYNEYKLVLIKKEYDKQKEEEKTINAFDLQLKQSVNAWNYNRQRNNMNLATIQVIFSQNNINFGYFANINNRECFIRLLKKHDIVLAAVDYLWYNLGGVPFYRDIDINKKDEDMHTDLDLDGLAIEILGANVMSVEMDEKKQEIECNENQQLIHNEMHNLIQHNVIQQKLIQILEKQNQCKNALLECYLSMGRIEEDNEMQYELPPWDEFNV